MLYNAMLIICIDEGNKNMLNKILVIVACSLGITLTFADTFPQTFNHVYGTTVVQQKPLRVVSLSYGRSDTLWALGVKPVGVRHWYGDNKYGAWAWAQETFQSFGNTYTPEVFPRGALDFEKIVALKPDLILALWSGIKQEEYEVLSKIAPTIAHEQQYGAYATPWDVQTITVGRAVGESEQAQAEVDRINAKIQAIADAHPEWQGKTAAVAFYWKDKPGAYADTDIRARLINQMGFITPERIKQDAKGKYLASYAVEDFSPLDTDVLFWVVAKEADVENVKSLTMRKTMRVYKQGREVAVDELLTGAFSHANILSLDYALDTIVPLIEQAVDGDPTTVVTSSQKVGLVD